jgi:hypothetical protein
MQFLLPLAVRVEALAKVPDALLEREFVEGGEWEGVEDNCWLPPWTIFKPWRHNTQPALMNNRRQYTQNQGIV